MEENLGILDRKWEIEKFGFHVYRIGEEIAIIQRPWRRQCFCGFQSNLSLDFFFLSLLFILVLVVWHMTWHAKWVV